ncbi:MAG: 5-bromo-4-chloroindolyl phosphate hydrolysis family protein [Candidatus Electrothrix sp.]
MYAIIRETVSGLGAAFSFLVLIWFSPWWLSLCLSLATYFGIRLFFPPPYKKVEVELPDGLSEAVFKTFLSACAESLALLRKDAESINKLPFRRTVLHLCELGDELLINFEKDPQDVQVARELPDRLHRLHQVIAGYLELANQRNQSPQTVRAIQDTEKAVTKAVTKFEQLHHRLLENDAIDLSTNAKTLDNLLDFD